MGAQHADPARHVFVRELAAPERPGLRLAVKDVIDLEGIETTAGSKVVSELATPAAADAAYMLGARQAGARIVGKTNLVELAFGPSGINAWFGTPANPLDPSRGPGGSLSGSAVAVAIGLTDVGVWLRSIPVARFG
jgi:amidase